MLASVPIQVGVPSVWAFSGKTLSALVTSHVFWPFQAVWSILDCLHQA